MGRLLEAGAARPCAALLHLLVVVALLLAASVAVGQPLDTVWTRVFDSGRFDCLLEGAIDPFGDIVLCGVVYDGSGGGNPTALVVKYDPSGDTVWSRSYDSPDDDNAGGLAVDSDGNVIVVGAYVTPGDTLGGEVLKYDRNGNLLWVRRYLPNGSTTDLCGALVDDSMNIYACGYCFVGGSYDDALLMKLSPDGDSLWTKTYDLGGDWMEAFDRLEWDREGCIVGIGTTGDDDNTDFITVKFDRDGDTIWTRRLSFQAEEWPTAVAVDSSNNIVVTGLADDGNMVIPFACVLFKYSSSGDLLWSRTYRFGPETYGGGVAVDRWGNFLLAATDDDTVPGPGTTPRCLVMKCDSMGDTVWTWRCRPYTDGFDLKLDDTDHIYVFGSFYNGSDPDFLVMKLRYESGIEDEVRPPPGLRCVGYGVSSPVRSEGPVRFWTSKPGRYRIDLVDVLGRKARVLYDGPLTRGEHLLGLGELPAGVYSLRIAAGDGVTAWPLVVTE